MLLMSPFNDYFTWETTTIDEIISSTSDEVEFKTSHTHYILKKIYEDNID